MCHKIQVSVDLKVACTVYDMEDKLEELLTSMASILMTLMRASKKEIKQHMFTSLWRFCDFHMSLYFLLLITSRPQSDQLCVLLYCA